MRNIFDTSDAEQTQQYAAPLHLPSDSARQIATVKALAGETIQRLRAQLRACRSLLVVETAENRRLRDRIVELGGEP